MNDFWSIMSDSVLNHRIFLVVDQKDYRKLIVSSGSIFIIISTHY